MAKFIRFPWATTGDRAAIPDEVDPSGGVSYTQGFGPDYERDPATDPLAKRVPRPETNQYLYDATDNIRQYQLYGVPEWYPAADNGGVAISYPINAVVRHADVVYRSIVATNTVEPGTDPTKWVVDAAFNEASLAEAIAGTTGAAGITPRRMASAAQQSPWTYAIAGGTASAITVALAPAPASLSVGMVISFKVALANTVPATLDVNGLGAAPIVPFIKMTVGQIQTVAYDGVSWQIVAANAANLALATVTRAASIRSDASPLSVVTDTITTLPLTSFTDDGQGDFTPVSNTLVCQRAGRYQVSANFGGGLVSGAATALTFGMLTNASQTFSTTVRLNSASVVQIFGGASDVIDLAVSDVLTLWVFQSSGATRNLFLTNRLAIQRLAEA